jgi:hypothetical protein
VSLERALKRPLRVLKTKLAEVLGIAAPESAPTPNKDPSAKRIAGATAIAETTKPVWPPTLMGAAPSPEFAEA